MKKQVVVIHGGNAFETREEYLRHLKEKTITLDKLRGDWKRRLPETLGNEYDVLFISMPNSQNARYMEWKIMFDKIVPLLEQQVVMIGHSLGGIFLAKYLSENDYPKKILATFLVAAPFNTSTQHPLVDFIITEKFDRLAEQGGEIYLIHSKDDQVVRFHNYENYRQVLPEAKGILFQDRKHFNGRTFPEIIEVIKKVWH